MAQTKHTFIESKMNKDLDDRLLSGGQYRDAMNVAVSKSEDSDVGALENVLGNNFISNLFQGTETPAPGVQIIGGKVSNEKNSIYLFLTNYCDNSPNGFSNPATPGAYCAVVEYNTLTSVCHTLIEGNFLNFSTSNLITGINIIENLLFWTDNRNQPRKINIETARQNFSTSPYYINEDQISVAKYAPVFPPNVLTPETTRGVYWKDAEWNPWGNVDPGSGITKILVTSFILDPSITSWPELANYDKYDKFSVEGESKVFEIADFELDPTTSERVGIIVYPRIPANPPATGTGRKLTVYKNHAVDATSEYLPVTARAKIVNKNPNNYTLTANTVVDLAGTGNIQLSWESPRVSWAMLSNNVVQVSPNTGTWVGCGVFSNAIDENKYDSSGNRLNHVRFTQTNDTNFIPSGLALQQDIILTQGQEIYLDFRLPNPHYEAQFAGDEENLKEKFVRFAYRFKFDDNEYSLLSPFTQPLFIPNQDGYMLNQVQRFNSGLTDGLVNQQDNAGTETVLSWFENKLNKIGLNIPLEYNVNELFDKLKIKELQLIYKESDELALKVLDDIDFTVNNLEVVNNSTKTYKYNYQSAKPFKTLPESVITRTSDKVPLRALAQESSGNRIIYGNFIDKHTSPLTLDYLVSSGEKLGPISDGTINSFAEYPNHTLKQNRTYQVGVVLQDRYGRQSDVILAKPLQGNKIESPLGSGNFYGDSTIYHGYKSESFNGTSKVYDWYGDSLKVLFRNVIPEEITRPGYPGLYSNENPLGFYSYKIVVKQKQQDYYNVYLPSLLYGVPLQGEVKIPWISENSIGNTTDCNEPSQPANRVQNNQTTLGGLEDTSLLKQGMKFSLQSNTFDNTQTAAGCAAPARPCPNPCNPAGPGSTIPGYASCATYTITRIVDANTIEFSPAAINEYSPYCEQTDNTTCCDKRPATGSVADGVRNSQPERELVFSNSGSVVIGPKSVNNPDEMTTTLLTDNINKMPANLNEVRPNQNQFSTSDKIYYSRVAMRQGNKFFLSNTVGPISGTSLVYPAQINTSVNSDVVKVLADWDDLFSVNNVESGLYKTSTNPFTSILSNKFQIGSTTDEKQTFAVIETEPVISELDIFWETTTAGLISELNQSVRTIEELAGIGGSIDFSQPEDLQPSASSPAIVGKVFGINGLNSQIPTTISLLTVTDGNGLNLNGAYDIQISTSTTSEYDVRAIQPCVFVEDNLANQRIFTFEVTDQQTSSQNLTNIYSYSTEITNNTPDFLGYSVDPQLGQDGWPDNPNGTKINASISGFFPPISAWGCLGKVSYNQAGGLIFDNRIYNDNGSGGEFFILNQNPNEHSQINLRLEVSLDDPSNGGQFIPISGRTISYTVTPGGSSFSGQNQVSSTGALIPGPLNLTSLAGGPTTQTVTYETWGGFRLVKLGESTTNTTLPQYGIPNGVQSWGISFVYSDYISDDPGIRDSNGQLRIDPNTGLPYIEGGAEAVLQDFNSGWLGSRWIRIVAEDANGSPLSLQKSLGSNIAQQEGIKFDFELAGAPQDGVIESYYVSGSGGGYNPIFDVTNHDPSNQPGFCCGTGVGSSSALQSASDTPGSNQVPDTVGSPPPGNPFGTAYSFNFLKLGN